MFEKIIFGKQSLSCIPSMIISFPGQITTWAHLCDCYIFLTNVSSGNESIKFRDSFKT